MSEPQAELEGKDDPRLEKLAAIAAKESTWAEAMGITRTEAYGMAHAAHRFLEVGQVDRARKIVEGLVVLNPNDAYFHSFLGALQGQGGDEAGAFKSYTAALALDPKNLAALVNRAELSLGKGELETAIGDLAAATRVDPQGATPLGKRAVSLARATAAALQEAVGGPKRKAPPPAPEPVKEGGFFKGLFGKKR
jgi:predicted Zn-dependent protease